MKQPDRFEREVKKIYKARWEAYGDDCGFSIDEIVRLLRREHAWMRQKIHKNPLFGAQNSDWKCGYTAALQWMLDQLTQRKK